MRRHFQECFANYTKNKNLIKNIKISQNCVDFPIYSRLTWMKVVKNHFQTASCHWIFCENPVKA